MDREGVARELLEIGRLLVAAEGDKWKKMPKGWTDESRKKFWESLTGKAPKHKVTRCIKQMDGKVDDPGAFCAALADRVLGKGWRSEAQKDKKSSANNVAKRFMRRSR